MRSLMSCCLLLTLAAPAVAADDCDHSKPVSLELDASDAAGLDIDAEAGFLVIEGIDSTTTVQVEATACASDERLLDDIRLESGRRGDRLWIDVDIPDRLFGWHSTARLDLTVHVPARLALDVRDGSGSIDIRHVGTLELEDGSGEIDISDVDGDVDLDDGSGEIDVTDVDGRVLLRDGSGSITLRNIRGEVRIDSDGSGEIDIADVDGDVEIGDDGSGGIDVRDVTGAVRIGSDGSGSIWIARVGRGFVLESDGSGSVHVEDVHGVIETP